MKAEAVVIQRPERQRPMQKFLFGVITVFAWLAWASLWLPLITALAWALGLGDLYVQFHLGHPLQSNGDLDIVLLSAVVCVVIFSSWSGYNHWRFAGRQKRRGGTPVSLPELAWKIGATADSARNLQEERRSVIQFDDRGHMVADRDALRAYKAQRGIDASPPDVDPVI